MQVSKFLAFDCSSVKGFVYFAHSLRMYTIFMANYRNKKFNPPPAFVNEPGGSVFPFIFSGCGRIYAGAATVDRKPCFFGAAWAERDRMVVYGSTETRTCRWRDGRPRLRAELWLSEVPRIAVYRVQTQYVRFTAYFKMYEVFASGMAVAEYLLSHQMI